MLRERDVLDHIEIWLWIEALNEAQLIDRRLRWGPLAESCVLTVMFANPGVQRRVRQLGDTFADSMRAALNGR